MTSRSEPNFAMPRTIRGRRSPTRRMKGRSVPCSSTTASYPSGQNPKLTGKTVTQVVLYPKSAKDEPQREQCRNDSDDPRWKRSNTDNEEPIRETLLKASELRKWMESRTDRENNDPNRAMPKSANDELQRVVLHTANEAPRWKSPLWRVTSRSVPCSSAPVGFPTESQRASQPDRI